MPTRARLLLCQFLDSVANGIKPTISYVEPVCKFLPDRCRGYEQFAVLSGVDDFLNFC
jgi:hypothetical protein